MSLFRNFPSFVFFTLLFGKISGSSEIGKTFVSSTVIQPNAIRINFIFAVVVANAKDTSSTPSCVENFLLATTHKPCNTIVATIMRTNATIPSGQLAFLPIFRSRLGIIKFVHLSVVAIFTLGVFLDDTFVDKPSVYLSRQFRILLLDKVDEQLCFLLIRQFG